jgi:hypothetical protein
MLDGGIRVVRVKTFITRNERYLLRIVDYASYAASAFVQGFRELRPEVVISSSPHLFVAVAGVLLARPPRVPHVFELRDLWPASIAANTSLRQRRVIRWLERLELWLYREATRANLETVLATAADSDAVPLNNFRAVAGPPAAPCGWFSTGRRL